MLTPIISFVKMKKRSARGRETERERRESENEREGGREKRK
jgi:hypothetical protein